jgi:twitching motility protein PilT
MNVEQQNVENQISLPELLRKMTDAGGSDLHLTTNSPPQVRVHGHLSPLPGYRPLTPAETKQLAYSVLTDAQKHRFEENLELDFSFGLKGMSRFRANLFNQKGAVGAVFRAIPYEIRSFDALGLPPVVSDLCKKPRGLVLVTGPTGSGKSTTLAAMIDKINIDRHDHILTIEDPIEFLHNHKKSTINQREVGADTKDFASALRAALRQAPKVILVGEMRDLETAEIALEAAETGHLVLSTLHTIDASKTIDRIIGLYPKNEERIIRTRLSQTFRYIVSQRLIPRADGKGRIAAVEILKSNPRTREYIEKGESEGKTLLDAIRDGEIDGMQDFDSVIRKMVEDKVITLEDGLSFATNQNNLLLQLKGLSSTEDFLSNGKPAAVSPVAPMPPAAAPAGSVLDMIE